MITNDHTMLSLPRDHTLVPSKAMAESISSNTILVPKTHIVSGPFKREEGVWMLPLAWLDI